MSEFTAQEISTEAQIIYDEVSEAAWVNGREMPWWSELSEEVMKTYLDRAKVKLVRRRDAYAALEKLNNSDVVAWLEDRGYCVEKI